MGVEPTAFLDLIQNDLPVAYRAGSFRGEGIEPSFLPTPSRSSFDFQQPGQFRGLESNQHKRVQSPSSYP